MIRALTLLSLFAAVSAQEFETKDLVKPVRIVEQADCLVDSTEIINDATDAALFIWASINRCGNKGTMVKCEVGVASSIQAVNGMMVVLIKALRQCGDVHTENQACGIAAGTMTERVAGLTAKSGAVVQQCTIKEDGGSFPLREPVNCAIDIKNTLKNLFKLVKAFLETNRNCNPDTQAENPARCATNAMKIINGFTGIGSFLAGAIGTCEPNPALHKGSRCAQASIGLVQQLNDVAEQGVELARKCERKDEIVEKAPVSTVPPTGADLVDEQIAEGERLYSQQGVFQQNAAGNTNVLLAAFLPVTAIVGFIGGRIYAARHSGSVAARDFMSDTEMSIE